MLRSTWRGPGRPLVTLGEALDGIGSATTWTLNSSKILRFPSKSCRDRDDLYSEFSRALSRVPQGDPLRGRHTAGLDRRGRARVQGPVGSDGNVAALVSPKGMNPREPTRCPRLPH
jgi:hypothetical protein